jgi:hypothetical protein
VRQSEVARAAFGDDAVVLEVEDIRGSLGAATASVSRLHGRSSAGPFSMIVKRVAPVTSGRHVKAAKNPRHWAYWRREVLAYGSGLLPTGPGLTAPRCYAVIGDAIYLEEAPPVPEDPGVAVSRLAAWQAFTAIPDVPWLAGDQLAQRLAVADMDWSDVDADPRCAAIWNRRAELLESVNGVERVLTHGDFHAGQLRAGGDTTVVLDWGTFGVSPAGFDIAHLALSTLRDWDDVYMAEVGSSLSADGVRCAYRVALLLTGVSRLHWMLTTGVEVPAGYVDFVLAHEIE